MDLFGIGAAVKAAAEIYFHAARQTGRTTALLDYVKNGDTVVFLGDKQARRFEQLTRERNLDIRCAVTPMNRLSDLGTWSTRRGRVLFDHEWIEEYHRLAIQQASENIRELERVLSRPEPEPVPPTRFTILRTGGWKP